MSSFSRLNTNLLQLKPANAQIKTTHLYFDGKVRSSHEEIFSVDYNKCFQLTNSDEHISYQWCNDFTVLVIYTMKDTFSRSVIYVHLPKPLLNKQFTSTVFECNGDINYPSLGFDLILKDGIFVNITLPLDFILSRIHLNEYPDNWARVLNPYDFSIRSPQYLFHVDNRFSVVFLKDGGLLGLKRVPLEVLNDFELQPVLFNDSSYLQSFTRIFSKFDNQNSAVVSATLLNENLLVTLTNDAAIKIWDLNSFHLAGHYDLNSKGRHMNYGTVGNYMLLLNSLLFVYLPTGNGCFQVLELDSLQSTEKISIKPISAEIPVNLSSYSIWSLLDMQILSQNALSNSNINLVVLWKSNMVTKVQLLSFQQPTFEEYTWTDCNNTYLSDLLDGEDLITNGSMEKSLLNLKSHYSQTTYDDAQNILNKNNLVVQVNDPQNQAYLTNLESVLKELHKQRQEPSSVTILNDEIILVNNLYAFHHSAYKLEEKIESIFFKILENNNVSSSPLEEFLSVLHGFSSTISSDTLTKVSERYLDIVNGSINPSLSLKDKITTVFQDCLQNGFQAANLSKLLEGLNSIDVIDVLDQFLHEHNKGTTEAIIDSLNTDVLSSTICMESITQYLSVFDKFIIDILLIFTILDIDFDTFEGRLTELINLHFNISMWLQISQIDKILAISETFKHTSKYGYGIRLRSNSDLTNFTNKMFEFVKTRVSDEPPLLIRAFNDFILNGQNMSLAKQFLHFVIKPYHISKKVNDEFLYALSLLKCEENDASLDVFLSNNFCQDLSLPSYLNVSENHPWFNLFQTIQNSNEAEYFYQLSILYSKMSSYSNALKTIKKSISLGGSSKDQLVQYIDILIVFGDYKEILDVLRLEQKTLDVASREKYYHKLLTDQKCSDLFTATLFQQCSVANIKNDSIFLSVEDNKIIASVLTSLVDLSDWTTFKKLFSYRILTQHERKACEVLFDYVLLGSDPTVKQRCLLLISNVLKTFTDVKDRWFVNSNGQIIHLYEITDKLSKYN